MVVGGREGREGKGGVDDDGKVLFSHGTVSSFRIGWSALLLVFLCVCACAGE